MFMWLKQLQTAGKKQNVVVPMTAVYYPEICPTTVPANSSVVMTIF